MTIGNGPFSAEQLDSLECPALAARHTVHAEFYEHTTDGWLRRFGMSAVVLPSSPHEATEGGVVQVLFEGRQEGVQLTGFHKPTYASLERGEQPIEMDDGVKVLTRWVLHCTRPQEHEV